MTQPGVNYTVKELLEQVHDRLGAMEKRLAAIERWRWTWPIPSVATLAALLALLARGGL